MPLVNWDTFIEAARSGKQVVSFPTDTVPALACHPNSANLLFEIKQRSLDKSLILMAASASDLWPYASGTPAELNLWMQVSEQYWPGALTLVLPASDRVSPNLNPLTPSTVGIRVPNSPIARQILAATGPLATTSANRSGEPALQTLNAIGQQFPEVCILSPEALPEFQREIQTALDQPIGSGTASSVIQWTQVGWKVLRSGAIDFSELELKILDD